MTTPAQEILHKADLFLEYLHRVQQLVNSDCKPSQQLQIISTAFAIHVEEGKCFSTLIDDLHVKSFSVPNNRTLSNKVNEVDDTFKNLQSTLNFLIELKSLRKATKKTWALKNRTVKNQIINDLQTRISQLAGQHIKLNTQSTRALQDLKNSISSLSIVSRSAL